MTRVSSILTLLVLGSLSACADSPDLPAPGAASGGGGPIPTGGGPALSPAGSRVSQIAARNGDRNYLMLDKTRGRIFVFENGRPTFSGAALTGENQSDFLAPDAFTKSFAEQKGLRYKVTPAGRYTVSPGFDHAYGVTLDVNEVQGTDWDIAIHRVWLGAPSEHRDARLRSPGGEDKHITYGCIDVDGSTMEGLLRRLPNADGTPLYILPADERLIMQLFQPSQAARRPPSPDG